MRRAAFGLALTLAISTVVTLSSDGNAEADAIATQNVPVATCSAINGLFEEGHQLKLTGCTGPTGGSGVAPAPFFTPTTIRWTGGGRTTVTFNGSVHIEKTCPGHNDEVTLQDGKVKSSTGRAAAIKGVFKASFCISANDHLSLRPGTEMVF